MESETLGNVTDLFKKDSSEVTLIERAMSDCNEFFQMKISSFLFGIEFNLLLVQVIQLSFLCS
jgi:hypothetical protein